MKKSRRPYLSIIIPIFNEEKRLENLKEITSYLRRQKMSWEIVTVNDGSTDKTEKILKDLKKKLHIRLLSYSPNKGKGYAIKVGMLNAKGRYRLFLDIDLSTPISEFSKFLPHLKKYGVIIGSRKMKSSKVMVRQPFIREYLGKVFTLLSQKVLQMSITDFTCGFKCFSQEAAEEIFSRQIINGWGFDSEILFIGKSKQHSILEIPVNWKNDPATKVKFPKDLVNSFKELIKIRINSYRGLYL